MFRKVKSKALKGLRSAGQGIKRTMGSAHTSEDPESELTINRQKTTKHLLREMMADAKAYIEAMKKAQEAEKKFRDSVSKLGMEELSGFDLNADEVKNFIEIDTIIGDVRTETLDKFQELVVTPTQLLLENEIEASRNLIAEYDSAHTDYDIWTAKVNKEHGDKQAHAQQELQRSSERFADVKVQMTASCDAVHAKKQELFASITAYGETLRGIHSQEALSGRVPNVAVNFAGPKHVAAAPSPMMNAAPAYASPEPSQPRASQSASTNTCVALYDYDAQSPDELTFKADDVIVIEDQNDGGWWQGRIQSGSNPGASGMFPSNYTEAR